MPGILNWAIAGLLDTGEDGLRPPPQVLAATKAYRNANDIFGTFLTECAEVAPSAQTRVCAISKAFAAWCERNGEPCTLRGTRKTRAALEERGHPITLDRFDSPQVAGLRLRVSAEDGFALN
jgi:putative DNA primase/helicase